ncbi:hypothetical protein JCM30237_19290 [Halolamina litorea]|uniref:Uncharacterized protein n=1 Tax=Halolamina litorea TaxID=1515593 RepID=A0ABD6BVD1_9EURY|nr:hypothetical protein [Halolamina litorea]
MTESTSERAVPADWAEVSNPDYIVEKYDPRAPTLFEYADRDIGVHILPAEPNVAHSDTHRWRLGFVKGHRDNLEEAEPVVLVHGRENAYHAAHVFMETYNEYDDRDHEVRVEAAKAAARDAVEDR